MAKTAVITMPVVGEGASHGYGSDSYPFTIVEVAPDGRWIVVQADDYKRTDNNGYGGQQVYEYTPNPNAEREKYTLRKDGHYHRDGSLMKHRNIMHLGGRYAYQDPSF